MRFLILLSFVLIATSCSTSKISTEQKKSKIDDVEISKIENSDFQSIKEIPFKESEDYFMGDENNYDSLAKESIARFPDFKLKLISGYTDVISSAVSLCYRDDFQSAFDKLDAVYFKYKRHPSYWNQVGTCYLLQGNIKKAKLFYNKSRGVSSKYIPALNNLGVLYQKQGMYEKSLYAFEKASKMSVFSLTPKFNLAQVYLKFGIYKKAKKIFKALSRKHGTDRDVLNGLAVSYLMEGKYTKSVSIFSKLEGDVLENPYYGLNYSLALKLSGDLDKAVSQFDNIQKKIDPKILSYYNNIKKIVKGL